MGQGNLSLTKSERLVLELLWETGKPLTSSQIAECADGWKPSYVHLLINSMLKKKVIEVSGFVQTGKNYARVFVPSLTREQCMICEALGDSPDGDKIVGVMRELVKMANEETMEEIRKIIKTS